MELTSSECTEEKVERLECGLREQASCYRMLLELAKRQAEELSAENLDAFMVILEEKKKIIEKIGELEALTQPLRNYWESHKEEIGEESRARLRSVVADVRAVLEELLQVESKSQQQLGGKKDGVHEQIRQLGIGSEAMRSYMKNTAGKARFMDEVG
jgi:hypothetical protein